MTLKFKLVLPLFFVQVLTFAQVNQFVKTRSSCGSPVPSQQWDAAFNSLVEKRTSNAATKSAAGSYTIPVIVHVIHGGQPVSTYPNISLAQVHSQIAVLNKDFAGQGLNVGQVPAPFAPLVANCNITFSLALFDTLGNVLPEPGIDRVNYVSNGWTNPANFSSESSFQNYFNTVIKPNTIWNPNQYLNVWVSDRHNSNNLLGYATFPANSGLFGISGGGDGQTDGIWVWGKCFGNTGSLNAPYNQGRTATHELGHWLGLRHIDGDANCGNDFCNDTPVQLDLNTGCWSFPKISCSNGPNGEMFMNFMDYCDDACLYMFTQGQRSRMHTAMDFGTYRMNLTASSATLCTLPAEAPQAFYSYQSDLCHTSYIVMSNSSFGFPSPTFSWSSSPATGVTFLTSKTAANPTVHISSPGTYEITLAATNSAGTHTVSKVFNILDCNDKVGLDELSTKTSFNFYPNPANNEIVFTGLTSGKVHVYNSIGQEVSVVKIEAGTDQTLDIHSLPSGVYTVCADIDGLRVARRLVISR